MPESVKRRGSSGPTTGAIVDLSMSSVAMRLTILRGVTAPYGSWPSPLTTDALVAGELRLGAPAFVGDALVWTERRPAEGGRSVLVRSDGVDLVRAPFNVRSRVHEYGGGAWSPLGDGAIVFSNDDDGRLYRLGGDGAPEPLTPEPPARRALRYADLCERGDGLVCVRESHVGDEVVNELVSVPDGRVIATGHDFYAAPRPSPDGTSLAWL